MKILVFLIGSFFFTHPAFAIAEDPTQTIETEPLTLIEMCLGHDGEPTRDLTKCIGQTFWVQRTLQSLQQLRQYSQTPMCLGPDGEPTTNLQNCIGQIFYVEVEEADRPELRPTHSTL